MPAFFCTVCPTTQTKVLQAEPARSSRCRLSGKLKASLSRRSLRSFSCPITQTKVFCQTFVHKSLRLPKAAPLAGSGTASQYINNINKNVQGPYPFSMLSHESAKCRLLPAFFFCTVCPPTQTKVFCQTFVHKSLRFPKAAPLVGLGTTSQHINIINKNV